MISAPVAERGRKAGPAAEGESDCIVPPFPDQLVGLLPSEALWSFHLAVALRVPPGNQPPGTYNLDYMIGTQRKQDLHLFGKEEDNGHLKKVLLIGTMELVGRWRWQPNMGDHVRDKYDSGREKHSGSGYLLRPFS